MYFQTPLLCWPSPHSSPVSLIRAGLPITWEDGAHWHICELGPWQPSPTPVSLGHSLWQTPVFPKRGSQTLAGPAPFAGLGARPRLEECLLAESGEPWCPLRLEWRGTCGPRRRVPDQDGPQAGDSSTKLAPSWARTSVLILGRSLDRFLFGKCIYYITRAMLNILSVRFMAFITFTMSYNHPCHFQNFSIAPNRDCNH